MINWLLCLIIGHKLHHQGEFRVIRGGVYTITFRCFRCGKPLTKKTELGETNELRD